MWNSAKEAKDREYESMDPISTEREQCPKVGSGQLDFRLGEKDISG